MAARNKRHSLLGLFVSYYEKKIFEYGPWTFSKDVMITNSVKIASKKIELLMGGGEGGHIAKGVTSLVHDLLVRSIFLTEA